MLPVALRLHNAELTPNRLIALIPKIQKKNVKMFVYGIHEIQSTLTRTRRVGVSPAFISQKLKFARRHYRENSVSQFYQINDMIVSYSLPNCKYNIFVQQT